MGLSVKSVVAAPLLFFTIGTSATPVFEPSRASSYRPHLAPIYRRNVVWKRADPTVTAPATFVHPGVLVSGKQLDFVKSKVAAKESPWADAYSAMLDDDLLKENPTPAPQATVACGSTSMNPDDGCHPERDDALIAYAYALSWYIEGDQDSADKAISYLNAWGSTFKGHSNDSESSNTPLQSGWAGAGWSRAAELMAYTNSSWADDDIDTFKQMLRDAYIPYLIDGSTVTGNWDLVMIEALQGMGVFLEDADLYNKAMKLFAARMPSYIYLQSDGALPSPAPSVDDDKDAIADDWYDQSTWQEDGQCEETCHDFVHTGYGLSSISHIAETARIQGTDLFKTETGLRLRMGLGFHSGYATGSSGSIPDWLCNGDQDKVAPDNFGPITEVGYNALAFRLNNSMPNTKSWTEQQRPAGTNELFVGWETLTHAMQPN